MISTKKNIYIAILSAIVIGASGFMITESARYFMPFYETGAWQPIYLAALLEIFLIALSIIKYGETWFRYLQTSIIVGLFVVIVAAAGISSILPTLEAIERQKVQTAQVELLEREIKSAEADSKVITGNIGLDLIARKDKTKTYDKARSELQQAEVIANTGRFAFLNMGLLIGIRLFVQLGNLVCARAIGVIYRSEAFDDAPAPEKKVRFNHKNSVLKIYPKAVAVKKAKWCYIVSKDRTIGKGVTEREAWKNVKI